MPVRRYWYWEDLSQFVEEAAEMLIKNGKFLFFANLSWKELRTPHTRNHVEGWTMTIAQIQCSDSAFIQTWRWYQNQQLLFNQSTKILTIRNLNQQRYIAKEAGH